MLFRKSREDGVNRRLHCDRRYRPYAGPARVGREAAGSARWHDLLNFADRSGRYSHYTAQDLGLKGIKT